MQKLFSYWIIFACCILLLPVSVFSQSQVNTRPKIGIVLSGGAAKGFAHIGALKVIEEAGLPVDYIGGTSMGGIIAGLYSIGYNSAELEKIALDENWNRLLSDDINRRDLSIEEKTEEDLFFVSFPIRESKVVLPTGIIAGQNIENRLNNLCAHVYNIRDFNEFQIPYLCVAMDVVTGREIVMRSGYLPQAMRSTMAIPSIFEPVKKDSLQLVDGGVLNNFPSDHVKNMGADILIGVDVGLHSDSSKQKNDLFTILGQTVTWTSKQKYQANRALCKILIAPDLSGYGLSSFNEADSIIARGEKAARAVLPALKALADSLNNLYNFTPVIPSYQPPDSFTLKEINISGMNRVSEALIRGKLQLEIPSKVTPDDISKAIDNAYSSLYFEKITYELQESDENSPGNGIRLNIHVREKKGILLRVGLNYNSDFKASIIFNATFRNLLLDGSKLSVNFGLGENPRFLATYFKNNGWKPGFGVDLELNNYDIFLYEGARKVSTLDFTDYSARLYTQSIFSNSYSLGLGFEFENQVIKPVISDVIFESQSEQFYNAYGFIHLDTYNNLYYPKVGSRFNAMYKLIYNASISPVHFLTYRYEQAVRINKRITLIPSVFGGISTADSATTAYQHHLGGMNQFYRQGQIPFTGLDFMQVSDRNVIAAGLNLQVNFWKKNYIVLRANAGVTAWDIKNLLPDKENGILGFGVSLGNNNLVGPIEITFMGSNLHKKPMAYLNIGYWF
jgi:NTE family protein